MEAVQDFLEFLIQYKDTPISWGYVACTAAIAVCFIILEEIYEVFIAKKRKFNLMAALFRVMIATIVILVIIWLFGSVSCILSLLLSLPIAFYVQQKYLGFVKEDTCTEDEIRNNIELQYLRRKFKENPHYSILEVLLYYGYISPLQKEYVETENIFKTPEEMAEKFLTLTVLTDKQLKEAKAIMNVIRREGDILTKQDALLIIAKIEERRKKDEEDLDEGVK